MNRGEEKALRSTFSGRKFSGLRVAGWGISARAAGLLAVVFVMLVGVVSSYSQSKAEKKELAALTQKANDGDASAQLELGDRYLTGKGVPMEDGVQARDWFTKAADKGNATAQFRLGEMYSTGWGIPQDKARAAIWYRKAAEQGLASAEYALGLLHESGRGATLNHQEAVSWIQKAANQDFAEAKAWMQTHAANQQPAGAKEAVQKEPAQDHSTGNAAPRESAAQVDIRYFPGDSRAVTETEMRAIRDSLRWDPETVVLKQGGTARSNLLNGKGQKLGSVLIRWDRTVAAGAQGNAAQPDEWKGQFSIQMENGSSCRFTSSAQLEDDQGFVVVSSATWSNWVKEHQAGGGETTQARGDGVWTQKFSSLVLRPLTAYSVLSGCSTPKNE